MTRVAPSVVSVDAHGRGGMRYDAVLHWYAVILALSTLFLLLAGAFVTSTGSALAVPDWPLTYGHNPITYPWSKWVGGVFYEHGHRLTASAVGLLTIGLVVLLHWREPRAWLRRLGWLALVGVILQGVLGGMRVVLLLPPIASIIHAALAELFLCTVVSMAVFVSPMWHHAPANQPTLDRGAALRYLCAAMCLLIYMQIILGAVVRHSDSGLAIPDFPLNYGRLVPPMDEASIARLNEDRRWGEVWLPQTTRAQIATHFAHRVGAGVVTLVILFTLWKVRRATQGGPWFRTPMLTMLALLPVQVGLGAATVLTHRDKLPNSFHVMVGASLLASSVWLTLRVWRAYASAVPSMTPGFAASNANLPRGLPA